MGIKIMSMIVDLYDRCMWPATGKLQEPKPTGPAFCGKMPADKIHFRRRCALEKIAGEHHLCQKCIKVASEA